jgi:UDP-glucose 4-epimerase
MKNKILIIGGSGFIGRAVALLLNNEGYSVRVFSPSATRYDWPADIVPVNGYVADKGILSEQVEWADIVLHTASTTNPKTSMSDPVHDVTSNLMPIVELLELLKNKNKKLIYCSSGGAVYGKPMQNPIEESHTKLPSTSYGLVKSLIEDYIVYYNRNFGLPYLIVRPANIYGPKLRSIGEQGIISTLLFKAYKKEETVIWSNPENIRDYLFIDDFAEGLTSLIKNDSEGIYNMGSGEGVTLTQIIDVVQSLLNSPMNIVFQEVIVKDEPFNVLCNKKIHQETGWKPQFSLEKGISITNDFLIKLKE